MSKIQSNIGRLSFSTTRIQCEVVGGGTSTGTGFFFNFNAGNNSSIAVIVTNKHVIAGAITGTIFLTHVDAVGNPIIGSIEQVKVDNFEKQWLPHPDESVDLCVMPLNVVSARQ